MNESQIAWSSTPVAEARARHAVALHRLAVAVPQLLRRVDVVDRRQHLAVQALQVVRLAEPVGRRPSSSRRPAPSTNVVQRKSSKPDPLDVVGHAFEVLGERLASGSRFTNTSGPHVSTCAAKQRDVLVAQRAEALARRHLAQLALQVPGPAVEPAAQLGEPAADALAQRVAAVAAHVLERAQLAVVAPHDQHGERADAVLEEVAGLGDVVDAARDLPARAATAAAARAPRTPATCSATSGPWSAIPCCCRPS